MAEVGMPLLIHGEVTTAGVDIFDKEARFIEEVIKVGVRHRLLACSLPFLVDTVPTYSKVVRTSFKLVVQELIAVALTFELEKADRWQSYSQDTHVNRISRGGD